MNPLFLDAKMNSRRSVIVQSHETDWINSKPVFYNTKSKAVSPVMANVIDWSNLEFDPEGLYNYLCFGYQVFGQTAFKNVKLLRFSSKLVQYRDENHSLRLEIEESPDPIDEIEGKRSTVEEALHYLKSHVRTFELSSRDSHTNKRFLLPLSGGYDSRLLATLIEDKSRIDAFTYDISLSEKYSFETVLAREICSRLGITWHEIALREYWNEGYVQKSFDSFCLEMPIHAAYHMEMYDQIVEKHGNEYIALSGSVGDWWSGLKVPLSPPSTFLDFDSLLFNHGISIPREFIKIKTDHSIKRHEFARNIERLKDDELFRIVFARRGRIGLATYIYRTAGHYFETYTPFYDLSIAMSQLRLPPEKRMKRRWLQDFFRDRQLGVEREKMIVSKEYGMDIKTAYYSLTSNELLSHPFLRDIVDSRRIEWINNQLMRIRKIPFPMLSSASRSFFEIDNRLRLPGVGGFFGRGFDYLYRVVFGASNLEKALAEWTVLKPIELALRRAENKVINVPKK